MVDFPESEELNELLASYVLGDLTPEEVARVNQLLKSHPELEVEVSRLQQTLALLPLSLPEASPPATLGSEIVQAASKDASNSATSESKIFRRKTESLPAGIWTNRVGRRPRIWLGLAGSIAASVLIGMSLYSYRLHQQVVATRAELSRYREAISLLRQPSNRLLSLQGTNVIPAASGSLVVVPSSEVIVLTLQNLTPLPEGQIYRLWGVANGQKIYCGEFNPDSQGRVLVEFPLDAEMSDSSSVVITVEPSQQLPHPTGETVMTGSMLL
jgi:anti-sigma-K factor RskA